MKKTDAIELLEMLRDCTLNIGEGFREALQMGIDALKEGNNEQSREEESN